MALSDDLTIVIPVRNEERNLPACLENMREFRHVVVVDSGSSDRTVEISKEFGREVVEFRWNGEFPKKRNWVLRNYRFETPWVMFLDADERVTEGWKGEVERVLETTSCDAFICYYDNWFMGRMLRYGDRMRKTALLRVGAGEYEKIDEHGWSKLDMEIHEHLQVRGEIGEIKSPLEHHDMRSLESYYAKHEEYATWEANRYCALMSSPASPESTYCNKWIGEKSDQTIRLAKLTPRQRLKYRLITKWWFGLAYFLASYILKKGFLDGYPGLVFARGKMRYFQSIRRKVYQKLKMQY